MEVRLNVVCEDGVWIDVQFGVDEEIEKRLVELYGKDWMNRWNVGKCLADLLNGK